MDWGDVPAWAAFALSAGALWIAFKARGDGKKSADASAKSADASVRSAVAAEEALTLQRREAEERRAAEEEAARPRAVLTLERPEQRRFILRNSGTAVAEGVTITEAGEEGQARDLPEGVTLHPGEGHPFFILTAMGLETPTRIYVTWEGQEEPVPLGVPGY
ncbi:hypothetical protein [Streptomyces sp. NPDC056948]|uniref:hypothetical protein n=1 Tax=Streptomyces sp. NPDC056948 TaxID=3345975 RepID=UPI003639487D